MEIQKSTTIQDVPENQWRALVGTDNIEQSYSWFQTIEESQVRDMQYIFIKEKSSLQAAACYFIDSYNAFGLNIPFVEVGSPLGMSPSVFSRTDHYTRILLEILSQPLQQTGGIAFLDLSEEQFTFMKQVIEGCIPSPPYENTYLDLHFSDFDDYLQSLPAKNRRSVKITLNRAEKKWKLTKYTTHEFSQWKEVAHRLQSYISAEHKNYRWLLPLSFYDALEKYVQEEAEMMFFFKDDIPLVFSLSLNSSHTCWYKFAGIDPAYRHYHAYFLLYYEGIREAIERHQNRIYFGTSNYEFKEKIGCAREPLYGLVKLHNPLLNFGLRCYIQGMKIMKKRVDFT